LHGTKSDGNSLCIAGGVTTLSSCPIRDISVVYHGIVRVLLIARHHPCNDETHQTIITCMRTMLSLACASVPYCFKETSDLMKIFGTLLGSPNVDSGRPNERLGVSFRGSFQGGEYTVHDLWNGRWLQARQSPSLRHWHLELSLPVPVAEPPFGHVQFQVTTVTRATSKVTVGPGSSRSESLAGALLL
jgi:hypothetical protein